MYFILREYNLCIMCKLRSNSPMIRLTPKLDTISLKLQSMFKHPAYVHTGRAFYRLTEFSVSIQQPVKDSPD